MNTAVIEQVVALAGETGRVFVLTADDKGVPHLTVAGTMQRVNDDEVAVTEWFCPTTMKNLSLNRNISVAVWNGRTDEGFQIKGEFQNARDEGMLGGYLSEDSVPADNQVLRRINIRITGVVSFAKLIHSDREVTR